MSLSTPNNFAEDVLEILKTRKVTFHGCPPSYLTLKGQAVTIWFYGHRIGELKPKAYGITVTANTVENAFVIGDSNALATACEAIIDKNHVRFNRPRSNKLG